MRKALFLSPLMLIFLAACSPQAYQVNPTPNIAENPNEVPESQKEGYMRITGNLRWDKMSSATSWEQKFPGCFQKKMTNGTVYLRASGEVYENSNLSANCVVNLGGLRAYVRSISLSIDSRNPGNSNANHIDLAMANGVDAEAFFEAIKGKYGETNTDSGDNAICSTYSCFIVSGTWIMVDPTPRTKSILDNVKIETKDL